jgi:hypothetical protein
MIDATCEEIRKGLVTLVVREKLERFDLDAFDKVTRKLFGDYNCYLPDCYEDPIILGRVLKALFGNSNVIVESIKDSLSEFAYQEPISRFISNLGIELEQRTIFVN